MTLPDDRIKVLVVEDDEDDFMLASDALEEAGLDTKNVSRAKNGQELVDRLEASLVGGRGEIPNLILLDLNMPLKNGKEALVEIEAISALKYIPIIVLTTSSNPDDVKFCYKHGAKSYIVKESFLDNYNANIGAIIEYWTEISTLPCH